MEKKIKKKFADLFEIGKHCKIKIDQKQLKLIIGGFREEENDNDDEHSPIT